MMRHRTAITAWPAFADLMTVLAVVGLFAAAVVVGDVYSRDELSKSIESEISKRDAEIESLAATVRKVKAALADRDSRIDSLTDRIAEVKHALDDQTQRADLAVQQAGGIDLPPCLGMGSGHRPKPLLQIVVRQGYELRQAWLPEDEALVEGIPRLHEAISHGRMDEGTFRQYADAIYRCGNAVDNIYGGACRFYVELKKETDSATEFVNAYTVVSRYFFISNNSEVMENLRVH